jgi:hypothetical protein
MLLAMWAMLIQRQFNGAGIAPSHLATALDTAIRSILNLCPFSQAPSYTVNRNTDGASAIPRLDIFCGPSTVTWRVVSIILLSIKRVIGAGASTDVLKELFVGFVAKFNSSTAISGIGFGSRIHTAILRRMENLIFRSCVYIASRVAVSEKSLLVLFATQAPARPGIPSNQRASAYRLDRAANTLTPPIALHANLICKSKDREPGKDLSLQVAKSWAVWFRREFNDKLSLRHFASTIGNLFRLKVLLTQCFRPFFILAQERCF